MELVVRSVLEGEGDVEVVEHKGTGHPDTMCDAIAETFAQDLARHYRERFGRVLHFNVDKALLIGGEARPRFGGGEVVAPMRVVLAGRATRAFGDATIPIEEIGRASATRWLRENIHALDADRHVAVDCVVRGGSADLVQLFAAGDRLPLANDTSIGVGHAPASRLERTVLAVAEYLRAMARERPYVGEDIKVVGVRVRDRLELTVACAFVDRHLANPSEYAERRSELAADVAGVARRAAASEVTVHLNAADDLAAGRFYLTVTGTSAEAGDDGEVGRGNRASGLITPYRPMSMEAAAGKNPVSHVGKLYNVMAQRIAERVAERVPQVAGAQCVMLSRIGSPVDDPVLVDVVLRTRDEVTTDVLRAPVAAIVGEAVAGFAELTRELIEGRVRVW